MPDAEPADTAQKISFALQETRILVLGVQVLLGFGFHAFFYPRFERLESTDQALLLLQLCLLQLVLTMLLTPAAFHRLAHDGKDRPGMHSFTTRIVEAALLPFALAIGTGAYVAANLVIGATGAVIFAAAVTLVALLLWYGAGLAAGKPQAWIERMEQQAPKIKPPSLTTQIERLLTEARVVLPGVQALFGFQFAALFTEAFERLSRTDQTVHLVSLSAMALSMMLLMAPAAFHRISTRGHSATAILVFGTGCVLAAMAALGLGLALDFYVILDKAWKNASLAALGAAASGLVMLVLWFGLPLVLRFSGRIGQHEPGARGA
jgi:hypothetical protein